MSCVDPASCDFWYCKNHLTCLIHDRKDGEHQLTPLEPMTVRKTFVCHYCGIEYCISFRTRDHKVPKSKGGKEGSNIVLACRRCNNEKGSQNYFHYIQWRLQHLLPVSKIALDALTEYANKVTRKSS